MKERLRSDHDRNADHPARAQRFRIARTGHGKSAGEREAGDGGGDAMSRDYGFFEADGLGWAIAECIESCDIASCDIALWLALGLGCAIAECMESCMALGLGD